VTSHDLLLTQQKQGATSASVLTVVEATGLATITSPTSADYEIIVYPSAANQWALAKAEMNTKDPRPWFVASDAYGFATYMQKGSETGPDKDAILYSVGDLTGITVDNLTYKNWTAAGSLTTVPADSLAVPPITSAFKRLALTFAPVGTTSTNTYNIDLYPVAC